MNQVPSPYFSEQDAANNRRVWAINTNRGGLATPTVEVGKGYALLTFGDGSVRIVTLADLAELETGREWFEQHPAPQ